VVVATAIKALVLVRVFLVKVITAVAALLLAVAAVAVLRKLEAMPHQTTAVSAATGLHHPSQVAQLPAQEVVEARAGIQVLSQQVEQAVAVMVADLRLFRPGLMDQTTQAAVVVVA
jgi:glucose/arabinose dehydrogenase